MADFEISKRVKQSIERKSFFAFTPEPPVFTKQSYGKMFAGQSKPFAFHVSASDFAPMACTRFALLMQRFAEAMQSIAEALQKFA